MNWLPHIESAIEKTLRSESNLKQEVLEIIGMCGEGNRHLYNNLANTPNTICLEIGTYMGASTASLLCNNTISLHSVDFVDENNPIRQQFLNNVAAFQEKSTFEFVNKDCFQVDVSLLPIFNLYVYDGEHYENDHYKALSYYYKNLDTQFVYVIDDWNWDFVRKGTLQAIDDLKLKIIYQKEFFSDVNESASPLKYGGCDARFWGNGVCVYLFEKTA